MINIRKSRERGKSTTDWLNSFHTFSFADYHDPQFMGFSSLRVINQDTILPESGFGRHPHHDMEIISYVISGELSHKDSMGNGAVIRPDEIQVMSAGTGVEHSEFNHSKIAEVHLLQIWIIPDERNLKPNYQQKEISKRKNQFILIGSKDGRDNSVVIHQDVSLYVTIMSSGHSLQYHFAEGRVGWLQLIRGSIELNGNTMSYGDGAAIQDEDEINIDCNIDAEFLLFELSK